MMKTGAGIVVALLISVLSVVPAAAAERFDSPEAAFAALVAAVRAGDTAALLRVLGPEAKGLVSSGDPVADRTGRERFAKAYDEAQRLEAGGGRIVRSEERRVGKECRL